MFALASESILMDKQGVDFNLIKHFNYSPNYLGTVVSCSNSKTNTFVCTKEQSVERSIALHNTN